MVVSAFTNFLQRKSYLNILIRTYLNFKFFTLQNSNRRKLNTSEITSHWIIVNVSCILVTLENSYHRYMYIGSDQIH